MTSSTSKEPDQPRPVLYVGQDAAGHWLVQDNDRRLEGRFISFAAALGFAHAERHSLPGATVAVTTAPLIPQVPFRPVAPAERALPRAA